MRLFHASFADMSHIFFYKSYEINSSFVRAAAAEWCLIIIIAYFGTLCMIKSPVFGFVITHHATIRSHTRINYL